MEFLTKEQTQDGGIDIFLVYGLHWFVIWIHSTIYYICTNIVIFKYDIQYIIIFIWHTFTIHKRKHTYVYIVLVYNWYYYMYFIILQIFYHVKSDIVNIYTFKITYIHITYMLSAMKHGHTFFWPRMHIYICMYVFYIFAIDWLIYLSIIHLFIYFFKRVDKSTYNWEWH